MMKNKFLYSISALLCIALVCLSAFTCKKSSSTEISTENDPGRDTVTISESVIQEVIEDLVKPAPEASPLKEETIQKKIDIVREKLRNTPFDKHACCIEFNKESELPCCCEAVLKDMEIMIKEEKWSEIEKLDGQDIILGECKKRKDFKDRYEKLFDE